MICLCHNKTTKNMCDIKLYTQYEFPKKYVTDFSEVRVSICVFMIDEYNDPLSGYYDYKKKSWFCLDNDSPIESVDFKWFYKPDFINY